MPYKGRLLEYTLYVDFSKDWIYKSIRPGKKAGDLVTDLRMIEYRPKGTLLWYKIDFDHEVQVLPHCPTQIHRIKPINQLSLNCN